MRVKLLVIEFKDNRPVSEAREYIFDNIEAIYIGRGKSNDVPLNDAGRTVSRNHALIAATATGYVLEDLESKNSTFVNGEKLDTGMQVGLKSGDQIGVGAFRIKYILEALTGKSESTRGKSRGADVGPGPSKVEPRMRAEPPTQVGQNIHHNGIAQEIRVEPRMTPTQTGQGRRNGKAHPTQAKAQWNQAPEPRETHQGPSGNGIDRSEENPFSAALDQALASLSHVCHLYDVADDNTRMHTFASALKKLKRSSKDHDAVRLLLGTLSGINPEDLERPAVKPTVDKKAQKDRHAMLVIDAMLPLFQRLIRIPVKFQRSFIGHEMEVEKDLTFLYEDSISKLKKYMLDPSSSVRITKHKLECLSRAVENVERHQAGVTEGYKAVVQNVFQMVLRDVDPTPLERDMTESSAFYKLFPSLGSKHVLSELKENLAKVQQIDPGVYEKRVYRPGFVRAYLAVMDGKEPAADPEPSEEVVPEPIEVKEKTDPVKKKAAKPSADTKNGLFANLDPVPAPETTIKRPKSELKEVKQTDEKGFKLFKTNGLA